MATTWPEHVARWKDCTACPLCHQRDRICIAKGGVPCDVLFVGEAPGQSEDAHGLVFVGPAGDLLDKIVYRAIGNIPVCATCGRVRLKDRDEWTCGIGHRSSQGHGGRDVTTAYTNLVCCFPREAKLRGDNEPEHDEITACRPRLVEFVNLAQPRLIVCVGGLASQYIDQQDTVPCCNIVHPAAILGHMRSMSQKDNAVLKTTVILRNAVMDVLESERKPFREWGTRDPITAGKGLHQRLKAWERDNADIDLPF